MSHDFAKAKNGNKGKGKGKPKRAKKPQNTRKQPETRKLSGWVYFACGVVFTLFAQFLVKLALIEPTPGEDSKPVTKSKAEKTIKPVIDFYEDLKQQSVEVSEEVVEKREQEDYNYVLQAGSFRKQDDANGLRAEIMLLGLDATIESGPNSKGELWHRVIVGPFTSRSKLNEARSQLIERDIQTLKIKRTS